MYKRCLLRLRGVSLTIFRLLGLRARLLAIQEVRKEGSCSQRGSSTPPARLPRRAALFKFWYGAHGDCLGLCGSVRAALPVRMHLPAAVAVPPPASVRHRAAPRLAACYPSPSRCTRRGWRRGAQRWYFGGRRASFSHHRSHTFLTSRLALALSLHTAVLRRQATRMRLECQRGRPRTGQPP